jgi:hypothetical protein
VPRLARFADLSFEARGRGEIVGDAKDRTVIPNPISLLCILLERNFSLELVIVA